MLLAGSSVVCAQSRKESVNMKICQYKFPKLKSKRKNRRKITIKDYNRYSIHITKMPGGE